MDGNDFDQFAKQLSAAWSRRGLLPLLAALVGWFSLLASDERAAGKGTGGRKGGKRHGHNHPRRRHARKRRRHHKKNHDSPVTCSPQSPKGACDAGQLCVEGACQACTVTCDGDPLDCGAALQAAIDAATATGAEAVYVCPGRYAGNFVIDAGVELIGAGDGDDDTVDTILDAQGVGRVLTIQLGGAGEVSLTGLRLSGGSGNNGGGGIFNSNGRMLTMTRCTVSGNLTANQGAGGGIANEGTLTLTDCLVADNSADGSGGGIHTRGDMSLAGATEVRGNSTGLRGGGILVRSGSVTIGADCRVTENTSQAGQGSGIYIDDEGDASVMLESDQIVTDNSGGNCFPVDTIPNCVG
jgi:predicted outer membrane repeat protein